MSLVQIGRNFPLPKNFLNLICYRILDQQPKSLVETSMDAIRPGGFEGFKRLEGIFNFIVQNRER